METVINNVKNQNVITRGLKGLDPIIVVVSRAVRLHISMNKEQTISSKHI